MTRRPSNRAISAHQRLANHALVRTAFSMLVAVSAPPLISILGSAGTTAMAVTRNYVGPASGAGANWNNASNWSPAGVPGSGDNAFITNTDAAKRTVTLDLTTTVTQLHLGNSGEGNNTLLQNGAFNLTCAGFGSGEFVGSNVDEKAVHTQSAGNNTLTTLRVGNGADSNGTYNLSGGTVTVLGGISSTLYIGLAGTGKFNHTGGAVTVGSASGNGIFELGDAAGVTGNYSMSNAASSLTVNGGELIGAGGIGSFTQTGGTHTVGTVAAPGVVSLATNAGSSGTYTLGGANSVFTVNGNVNVGGASFAAGGTGVLNVSGGTMTTTGTLKVWKGGTVSVQAGTLNAGAISLESNAPGGFGARLELGPNVTIASPLSLGSGATLRGDVNSRYTGTITVPAGAGSVTLDSGVGASSVLRIDGMANQYTGGSGAQTSVQGAGTVSLPFSNDYQGDWAIHNGTLSIGHASSLGTGTSAVSILAALQINGATLNRAIQLYNGATLRGTGTAACNGAVNFVAAVPAAVTLATGTSVADVFTIRHITRTVGGHLSIHVSGAGTVRLAGPNIGLTDTTWMVDSGTLSVETSDSLGHGTAVVNSGGTLEVRYGVSTPLTLNPGATLRGTGSASISETTTVASGAAVTLATGTSGSDILKLQAGVLSGGGGASTITVAGAGQVVLVDNGSYIGNWTIAASTLVVESGLVVDLGEAITGSGTVDSPNSPATPTIINGAAQGNSASAPLIFTGHVKGAGTFDHVTFAGTFDPGLSPAITTAGSITFAPTNTLIMELGGAAPGSGYDQIQASGTLGLDGTLAVTLINGFNPAAGNSFNLFDWAGVAGTFDSLQLPILAGLSWDTSRLYTDGVLSVASPFLEADFNENSFVNAEDLALWKTGFGTSSNATHLQGDANGDLDVDGGDFLTWQRQLGSPAITAAAEPVP